MLILRFTTKAFKKFSKKPQLIEVDKTEKDFGEWYVNTVDSANRGNLFMLVVHAESLYSILVPVSLDLLRAQVGRHMDRNFCQAQLLRRFVAGVAADDDAVAIDDNRLPEAKLLEAGRHCVHRVVINARVVVIRTDVLDTSNFDVKFHGHCKSPVHVKN